MKNIIICFFALVVISCSNNSTKPEPQNSVKTVYLHAYDYAKNFFFLDNTYKPIYDEYISHVTLVIPNNDTAKFYRIKKIEVWESVNNAMNFYVGTAFADLLAIQSLKLENYPDSMKQLQTIMGQIERLVWRKMDSTEYTINPYIGIISINNLRPERFYGAAYRIEGASTASDDDLFYGTLTSQMNYNDTLILKLIYRPNMQPGFKSLWQRQIKNKYYMGEQNIDISKSEIMLYYINAKNDTLDYFLDTNEKLCTILETDFIDNNTGSPPADGKTDLRREVFDNETGILTFLSYEPFNDLILKYFTAKQIPDSASKYIYPEVYDATQYDAKAAVAKDKYLIVFKKY